MNGRFEAEDRAHGKRWASDRIRSGRPAVLTLGILLFFLSTFARSELILGQTDWDTAGLQGWTSSDGWVSIANPGSGGITNSGFLQVTLAATDPFNQGLDEWWALVSTPATNIFAGSWDTNMYIAFDLYADTILPEYVQVQWGSTNSSHVWRNTVYDINDGGLSVGDWTEVKAMFQDYSSWDYGGGTQQEFLDDLAAIDWIGVYIWRGSADEQVYGVDRFRLMIPEPGQVFVLAAAMLSCAWFFRKKRMSFRWCG